MASAQAPAMPILPMCILGPALLSAIASVTAAVTFTVDPRDTLSEKQAAF